jgi:hypothetical protein
VTDPLVALVIPIYRQPSLAIEAIESALRQRPPFDYRIVLVNDGCPFDETHHICRGYANAYPDRIRYVRRSNGGLSAARNTGVEVALRAWPSVEAIQFLDADDRIGPLAIHKFYAALQEHPEAAWAYPSCRRFGSTSDYVMMDGPWSALELIAHNYVLCASMVRRRVFEAGLRYDETMKLGYEDWDFWMQCIRSRMRGIYVPDVDFQYRSRADSMLAESAPNHEAIMGYLRRKHASWCTPRRALDMEHREIPRYAIYLADEERVLLTSDPSRDERSIPLSDLVAELARAMANPQLVRFPHFVVVTSAAFLLAARQGRYTAGLLWSLQSELELSGAGIMAAALDQRPAMDVMLAFSVEAEGKNIAPRVSIAVLSRMLLHRLLTECDARAFRDLPRDQGDAVVSCRLIQYASPGASPEYQPDALQELAGLLDKIGPQYRRTPRVCLSPGKFPARSTGGSSEVATEIFGAGPLLPQLLDDSRIHIGFALPVCKFGGAERATMNFARESRRRGWVPHLFVIGDDSAHLLAEFRDTFDAITVVRPGQLCRPDRLLGLLGGMNVVVNNLSQPVNDVLSGLRRFGVKTLCHLHSVITSPDRMPTGQSYEVLRYEHSVDGVIVISEKLRRWCRAWGIPDAKLILVPNAPSFEVSDALISTVLEQRAGRPPDAPLNVLYLGRFDWEKGMDRLLALCERARQRLYR